MPKGGANMDKKLMETYLDILREELVPAMGCTEPIAIAYAAALCRDTLPAVMEEPPPPPGPPEEP